LDVRTTKIIRLKCIYLVKWNHENSFHIVQENVIIN
jgi:hypothetical protein